MSDKAILTLTSLTISCGAIAHLIRFFLNIPLSIGTYTLPGWTGAIFYLGLSFLACYSFRAIKTFSSQNPTFPSNP